MMSITVLIATYNRAALLERCLACLASQPFEAGDEVVVVDNGSTDHTAEVVGRAAASSTVPVRYILEKQPGKSYALSTGIAASHGNILALTDDDVLVEKDWLSVIRELWRVHDPGLVGGRVLPDWQTPPPAWLRIESASGFGPLSAPLALLDYGAGQVPLGTRTALGANMAVSREALLAAGGFPPGLGKLRGTLLSGEDHQVCERVQAAGYKALYEPRMVVLHHVPADRLTFSYQVRWFFWSGITNAALDARGHIRVRTRYWVRRIVSGLAISAAATLTGRLTRAVEQVTDVAFSLGYLGFSRGWVRTGAKADGDAARRMEAA